MATFLGESGSPAMLDYSGPTEYGYSGSGMPNPVSTGGTLSSFLASPIAGLALGGIGLISSGIQGWLGYKQQERQRREERAWRKEQMELQKQQMAEARARFEQEMALSEKRFGLDRTQVIAQLQQQETNNERYVDETNNSRAGAWYQNLMAMVNAPQARHKIGLAYA